MNSETISNVGVTAVPASELAGNASGAMTVPASSAAANVPAPIQEPAKTDGITTGQKVALGVAGGAAALGLGYLVYVLIKKHKAKKETTEKVNADKAETEKK